MEQTDFTRGLDGRMFAANMAAKVLSDAEIEKRRQEAKSRPRFDVFEEERKLLKAFEYLKEVPYLDRLLLGAFINPRMFSVVMIYKHEIRQGYEKAAPQDDAFTKLLQEAPYAVALQRYPWEYCIGFEGDEGIFRFLNGDGRAETVRYYGSIPLK